MKNHIARVRFYREERTLAISDDPPHVAIYYYFAVLCLFFRIANCEWVDDRAIFEALFSTVPLLKLAQKRRKDVETYYRLLVARR